MNLSLFVNTGRALSLCLLGCTVSATASAGTEPEAALGFDLTLERATELQDAGSYDAELQIYQSLCEDGPADPHLLFEMARASLAAGNFSACVDYSLRSSVSESRDQGAAFGVLAKGQHRSPPRRGQSRVAERASPAIRKVRRIPGTEPGDVPA